MGHSADLGQEVLRQHRDIRLFKASGGEDVHHALGGDRLRDDLAHGEVEFFLGARLARRFLGQGRPDRLEEPNVVADSLCLLVRHGQREGERKLPYRVQAALLAVLLGQDVLLGRREQPQSLLRSSRRPERPVEAVEESAADVVLLEHDRDRLLLVQRRLTLAAAFGVGGQGLLQVLRQPQVVDDQAAGLVLEHAIYARDGLHQPVAAHRLVDVHGVQAGGVEACEPHVAHQHDLQRVVGVAEPFGEPLSPRLVADVRLPVHGVRRGAGHHDLDCSPAVVGVVPVGTQAHQLAVEVDADATAHAHDHGLAVQHLQPLLEVGHDVLGDLLDALLRADDRLQLRPPGLELLLALDFLALGGLLKVRVDTGQLALVQRQFGQTALVVDGHRGPVLHGPLDVVDADVLAEDSAGVGVLQARWAFR